MEETLVAMSNGGPGLVYDLGVVVAAAGLVALVFHRLRWPVIFGYLGVGMLLGPYVLPGRSPIHDLEAVRELSELGVIFLLFFIGMEFDLRKLRQVLGPSLGAVALQTAGMFVLAKLIGPLLGWSAVGSVFFASLLAISSSMVTIRVLRDQGRMKTSHAQLAVGVLILEDVLAVIMLVVLAGVAAQKQLDFGSAWLTTFLMAVFVVGVFFVGRLIAPRVIDRLAKEGSAEQNTLFSLGLALGISALALQFEFSVALGAFLAGAILSQTRLADEFEKSNRAVHDLFSAVFFVTVGMLVDPALLLANWAWILGLALAVVVGKVLTVYVGLFLTGQSPRSSFRAAVAKAQIGEFSFIIAELGRQLEVTDERLTSLAFGVAIVTIVATSPLAKRSEGMYYGLAGVMPRGLRQFGAFYRGFVESVQSVLGRSMVLKLMTRPMLQVGVYFFLICGILVAASYGAGVAQEMAMAEAWAWGPIAVLLVAALLVVPFLIAIIRNVNALVFLASEAIFAQGTSRPIMQGRLGGLFNTVTLLFSMVLVGGLFFAVASPYLPKGWALAAFVLLVALFAGLFWRRMIRVNSRLEYLFMNSFSEQAHEAEERRREAVIKEVTEKYPWPAHVHEVAVKDGSVACGRRVRELGIREETGVSIIAIGRGGLQHYDPGPDTVLFPGDRLLLFGTKEQTARAEGQLGAQGKSAAEACSASSFRMERVYVEAGASLDGETLAGADVRRRFGVNVVGIQRGAEQINSPRPDELMRAGDVLLAVGSATRIREFERCECLAAGAAGAAGG